MVSENVLILMRVYPTARHMLKFNEFSTSSFLYGLTLVSDLPTKQEDVGKLNLAEYRQLGVKVKERNDLRVVIVGRSVVKRYGDKDSYHYIEYIDLDVHHSARKTYYIGTKKVEEHEYLLGVLANNDAH